MRFSCSEIILILSSLCHPSSESMLLAQINRDSQGMAEFHDADGQPVTLCLAEAVTVAGELPASHDIIDCFV